MIHQPASRSGGPLYRFYRWMYKHGRPNRLARLMNWISAIQFSTGLILPLRAATLEVVARRTGRLISFPVALTEYQGERYVVAMLGEGTNWVRNVRAAGGRAVLRHGRREATIGEARFMIDLAAELAAPTVRVFGGELPANMTVDDTLPLAADLLRRMASYAATRGITVLVETHDTAWSRSRNVAALIAATSNPSAAVLYDVLHPCRVGESPGETLALLGAHIRLVHLKDAHRPADGSDRWRLCMMGEGDMPLAAALAGLRSQGYDDWYSFEWEKHWHPELAKPEIALPAANRAIHVMEYANTGEI